MITIELSEEQAEIIMGFLGELLENPDPDNVPALLNTYTQIYNQIVIEDNSEWDTADD